MQYFRAIDYKTMLIPEPDSQAFQQLHERFVALHKSLYSQFKNDLPQLHPDPTIPNAVGLKSASGYSPDNVLTLTYTRSRPDAKLVEELMGRDATIYAGNIETHRHPVIELRINPDYFVTEFIISPDAWYDQQNLAGKLSIPQQNTELYTLLKGLKGNYRLGFWKGVETNDMYLNTLQLPPDYVFREFVETFAPRRDWFRLGVWYEPNDAVLADDNMVNECLNRITELYELFEFARWNGNNNYSNFYGSK